MIYAFPKIHIIHWIDLSYAQGSENIGPTHIILDKLFAALFVENLQNLKLALINLFVFKTFLEVSPVFVSLLSLTEVFFFSVVFGNILSQNHEKLFEGWRFADSAYPQQKDGEVGVLKVDFSLGIVLDKFFDVHKAELVHHLLLWSHRVSELPT